MRRTVAIYTRVSTLDQNPTSQLHDLEELARQRDFDVVKVYTDHGVSGTRERRPALDELLADAHRGRFNVLLVWAADRLARSTKHFLELLGEFDRLGIAFISYRENIDSSGPLGRAIMTIVAAIAELERSLIVERVRSGMRRARLEGRHIGRPALVLDRESIRRERAAGRSLGQIAKTLRISRSTVSRVLKEASHVEAVQ